ncbi:MAG: dihydroneopterin aldolase [Nitriliruptorales bacterium]|nr:dihydroneopterin aldolase [Nitriliruptorales bacterium]
MDRIEIKGVRARGRHGVFEEERRHGQPFVVDLTLELDLSAAASTDSLGETVDYGILAQQVGDAIQSTRFNLIEALAGHIADLALADPSVVAVEVRVAKPDAPINVELTEVAVAVRKARRQ